MGSEAGRGENAEDVRVIIYLMPRADGASYASVEFVDVRSVSSPTSESGIGLYGRLDASLDGRDIAEHVIEEYKDQLIRIIFIPPFQGSPHELDLLGKIWREFYAAMDNEVDVIWGDGKQVVPSIGLPMDIAIELLSSSIGQIYTGNPCLRIPDEYFKAAQTYFAELADAEEIGKSHQTMDPRVKISLPEPIQDVVSQIDSSEGEIGIELKASIEGVNYNFQEAVELNREVRPRLNALAKGAPKLFKGEGIERVLPAPWLEEIRAGVQSR